MTMKELILRHTFLALVVFLVFSVMLAILFEVIDILLDNRRDDDDES